MALTEVEVLRQMLGESIPAGGSEGDTLFTDEEVQEFLTRASGDHALANYYGWVAKTAAVANLVDTTEGQTKLSFSKLHDAAIKEREQAAKDAQIVGYVTDRSVIQRPIVRR